MEDQNKESQAFWSSIVSFCNTFCEDNENHIVEGVALLPSLVNEMKNKPKNVIFIGNESDLHVDSLLEYSKTFPQQDWMGAMNYSEDRIKAMANFIKSMSAYFRKEAEKYAFKYFEIDDQNFSEDIESIATYLSK